MKKFKGLLAAVLCMICLSAIAPGTAFAAANPPSYVNRYGTTPFDEAYSSGYINLGGGGVGSVPSGVSSGAWSDVYRVSACDTFDITNSERTYVWGTNRSKNDGIYVDWPSGAVMNGVGYDVRRYFWVTGTQRFWVTRLEDGIVYFVDVNRTGATQINQEFHFYHAGHCGDPNYEVTFMGVMCMKDLDETEGYTITQGGSGSWATYPTKVRFSNANKFVGTAATNDGDDQGKVWVQVYGAPGAPLTLQYTTTEWLYGSRINYWGNTINYVVFGDPIYGMPSGGGMSPLHGSATYGTYRYERPMPIENWEFNGWYYDAGLTNPVPATEVITENKTVYGQWKRAVFAVTTSVANGSITPSNAEVIQGTNYTVSYSPNGGYLLTSVVVDGTSVNLEQYPDSYTFAGISADHSVSVTYVAPSAGKTWVKDS